MNPLSQQESVELLNDYITVYLTRPKIAIKATHVVEFCPIKKNPQLNL